MLPAKEIDKTIGLIAGQGAIPEALVARWQEQGFTPVIVCLKDIADPSVFKNQIVAELKIGQVGAILNFFKSHGVTKLVMVGAMTRPNFWTIIPDMGGISILFKLLIRKRGDDSLLRFIRQEIERYGINVVGAHDYLPELLCPKGVLTKTPPSAEDLKTIAIGFTAAKQHGAEDKGQSIVVNASGVIATEGKEGTNALISACAGQTDAILVKVSKPQQDMALDMPTIGIHTAQNTLKSGFKGIAVESGKTIIIDQDEVVRFCNEHGLFLMGLEG